MEEVREEIVKIIINCISSNLLLIIKAFRKIKFSFYPHLISLPFWFSYDSFVTPSIPILTTQSQTCPTQTYGGGGEGHVGVF